MRKSFVKLLDVVEEEDIFHHVQTKGQDIQQKTFWSNSWLSLLGFGILASDPRKFLLEAGGCLISSRMGRTTRGRLVSSSRRAWEREEAGKRGK
jgi:hypothetical protein